MSGKEAGSNAPPKNKSLERPPSKENRDKPRQSKRQNGRPKVVAGRTHMKIVEPDQVSTKESHSTMVGGIRGVVSKKKRRFIDEEFDLDLTYITQRLIAMGFPAENYERLYRNSMDMTVQFFEERHKGHYWVYNLCSERTYNEERFKNRVIRFGFDDHNCPIFESMQQLCEHLDEWLSRDPENIAALHCKAGKGRTGLMICVYLIHTGFCGTAEEAMQFYAYNRTKNKKGVTIPSQRRWVHYYAQQMKRMVDGSLIHHRSRPFRIKKIILSKEAPKFSQVNVYNDQSLYETYTGGEFLETRSLMVAQDTKNNCVSSSTEHGWKIQKTKDGMVVIDVPDVEVWKDVKIQFEANKWMGAKQKRVMSFWFHTDFISVNEPLHLTKDVIDKVNKNKSMSDFYVKVMFESPDVAATPNLQHHLTRKLFPSYSADGLSTSSLFEQAGPDIPNNRNLSDERLVVLGILMQGNLDIKNRVWRNVAYQKSFVGAEAAAYLQQEMGFQDEEDIINILSRMLENRFFDQLRMDEKDDFDPFVFRNTHQFYRFNTSVHTIRD